MTKKGRSKDWNSAILYACVATGGMQDPGGVFGIMQVGIDTQQFTDKEVNHDALRLSQPGIQLRGAL